MFKSKAVHRGRHAFAATAAAVALAVLAACGGGTSQYEPFIADRVIAFGDDTSALRSDGRRFGTNGLTDAGVFDCNREPLWVQQVAGLYGVVFAECNTATPPATPRAFMRAAVGAKVADLQTQVDAQIAAGGFGRNDLALLAAGANDIFELYAQYPAQSREALLAEARVRGERMAQAVNRLVGLGARVVVANLADLGMSPYARAEAAANPTGISRTRLLTDLGIVFNEQLGIKVLLDGRFVGLVQMDLRTQQAARSPGSFGLSDVSTAVCTVALPDCTTATLVTGGVAGAWLWADDKRLASGGQAQLTQLAVERAQRNPF
ncbi:MAG: esterase [Rubrivivax sp.]|nr:esterase [Rubrivivax sp.]